MQSAGSRPLPYLALGKVQDCTILATHSCFDNEELRASARDVFQKLLQVGTTKFSRGQRTRLKWHCGSVCCFLDAQGILLYCLVTSDLSYPERLAYQLLFDLSAVVQQLGPFENLTENSLAETVQPRMRELIVQYEDPSSIPQLQATINVLDRELDFSLESVDARDIARQRRRAWLRKFTWGCTIVVLIMLTIILCVGIQIMVKRQRLVAANVY